MKCVSFFATFLGFVCFGFLPSAAGHGFTLDLTNNAITASSEVTTPSQHLFAAEFDPFSQTEVFTDHGGVEADAGFNLPSDTLSVKFLSPLWYSSGGIAQLASSGITLNATSYDTDVVPNTVLGSVNITGSSLHPGSFPVTGDDDHSIGWILSSPSDMPLPAGVYGFSYQVDGLKNGNPQTPFIPSDPLVVVFNTPGFTGSSSGSLSDAQLAIFSAIMRGDFNLDGLRSATDIAAMQQALADLNGYETSHDLQAADVAAIADVNQDGQITNADLQALLDLLRTSNGSTAPVPEPSAIVTAGVALLWLLVQCGTRC